MSIVSGYILKRIAKLISNFYFCLGIEKKMTAFIENIANFLIVTSQ